jgi:glyoxylase-like metal-dependent hydrolase (beta-lactamase superfamily II)
LAASDSLFTGDMLYDGSSGAAWPPDEPAAYCESLARPSELPVRRVYPGYYGPFDAARMTVLIETQSTDLSAHQYSERRA